MVEFINGAVYKCGVRTFVLIYIHPEWGMLHIGRHSTEGMSCPMLQHDSKGNFRFTINQLISEWNAHGWIMLDGRLRIEKIDDSSFVEYINGKLEPYNKRMQADN